MNNGDVVLVGKDGTEIAVSPDKAKKLIANGYYKRKEDTKTKPKDKSGK